MHRASEGHRSRDVCQRSERRHNVCPHKGFDEDVFDDFQELKISTV